MRISSTSNTPIYMQIANQIEEYILNDTFIKHNQVSSTTELSTTLNINPNTVLKGMNLLVDEKILYKKRGIGMFVSEDAKAIIISKRKKEFTKKFVDTLVDEALKLNITEEVLIDQIRNSFKSKEEM